MLQRPAILKIFIAAVYNLTHSLKIQSVFEEIPQRSDVKKNLSIKREM